MRRIITADGGLGSALDKMLGRTGSDAGITGRTGWSSRAGR
jgi:hypothetical protein